MTESEEWDKEPDVDALMRIANFEDFSDRERGYKSLAALGSILSMANLGAIYEYRPIELGGPDFELCEYWYNAAIAAGSAATTYEYGRFYIRQKNFVRAREILELGLERECAPAIIRLASLYIHGRVVKKDNRRATELLEKATDLGNIWAKRALANVYINIGSSPFIILKGYFLKITSWVEFVKEKRRYPGSERLKR